MSHFYTYWSHESVRLSRKFQAILLKNFPQSSYLVKHELHLTAATADLILILDIIITGIQIFYGLQLFNAVAEVIIIIPDISSVIT